MFNWNWPINTGNGWVCTQYCSYWFPGAKAPGHQHPQVWISIHCIGPVSNRNIAVIMRNSKKGIYFKKITHLFKSWRMIKKTLISQIAKFMRPTWDPAGSCRPQMGPMLAPWTLLLRISFQCALPYFPIVILDPLLAWINCILRYLSLGIDQGHVSRKLWA